MSEQAFHDRFYDRRAYEKHHSDGERELDPGAVVEMVAAAGFAAVEVCFTDAFISPLAWLFPQLPAPLVPPLAWLDQLVVDAPIVQRVSRGFAVIARNGA